MRGPKNTFRWGLLTLIGICVAVYFGFTKDNPFDDPFTMRAAFANVHDLKPKSQVRIAGIIVGKVTDIETVGKAGSTAAMVTIEISDRGLPLHTDATLKVRPRLFLEGNYFVDLQPGSPSAPVLKAGGTIPATQTAAPVGIGEVLTALQSDTRQDLRNVLKYYGRALEGEGARAYNRSIKYWEPAYKYSAIVSDATRGVLEHDLSQYVAASGKVADALDRSPDALRALITNLAQTASAFASEQFNLSAAIDELPRTLRIGYQAFGSLNDAFPSVRRFARAMTPAVRTSPATLDAQLPFIKQLRGLISEDELGGLARQLRKTVPVLIDLNEGGVDLQEQQRALSSCQANVISPWQDDTINDPAFKAAGPVYQEGVKWLPGIAAESRNFDANAQWVRSFAQNANYAYAVGAGRFYFSDLPLLGINPPPTPQPPLRPTEPCENQAPPELDSNAVLPPPPTRVDQDAPNAAVRRAQARQTLQQWMQDELVRSGLDQQYSLSNELLRADQIHLVAKSVGGNR